jgi:hypothetical protein
MTQVRQLSFSYYSTPMNLSEGQNLGDAPQSTLMLLKLERETSPFRGALGNPSLQQGQGVSTGEKRGGRVLQWLAVCSREVRSHRDLLEPAPMA